MVSGLCDVAARDFFLKNTSETARPAAVDKASLLVAVTLLLLDVLDILKQQDVSLMKLEAVGL